ncbi:MAG: hypothetical protein QOD77_1267 [Thermoplasmata archaeon]|jgi:hypothetical protein|nr:hypothetical protein [Thermoplasmata archaeon]
MTPKPKPHPTAELAAELATLHRDWKEARDQHRLRVEARFQETLAALRAPGPKGKPRQLPDADKVRKALRAVRLKPEKGRAKDLRRIEALLDELADLVPPA